jgi:hypothetical protein
MRPANHRNDTLDHGNKFLAEIFYSHSVIFFHQEKSFQDLSRAGVWQRAQQPQAHRQPLEPPATALQGLP